MKMRVLSSASILIGMIVGAGYLAIPYVVMKSGFVIGLVNMIIVGLLIMLTMLYLSEVILRTKKQHQIVGYAEQYLGKTGKRMMTFSMTIGICAALIAYLTAQGESWSHLLFNTAQYSLHSAIIFWLVMSALSYFGLRVLKKEAPIGIILITIMVILIAFTTASKINIDNLTYINPANFFIPFGVILFSFLGYSSLPEVAISLGKERGKLGKAVILALSFVFIIYLLFTFFVLGSQGSQTPEIATIALGKIFIVLGIITMLGAYLALSVTMEDILRADFGKSRTRAWLYSIFVPLILYLIIKLFNLATFSTVLSVGGVISGGVTITTILWMTYKAKQSSERKPEFSVPYSKFLAFLIILLFAAAIIFQIYAILS